MVADSITNSELFHGPPISRDFSKKRKTNWFCKLKQWKIDARRRQWIYQWKRANVGEEENGCCRLKSLQDKLTDRNTVRETCSYLEAWRIHHEEGGTYDFRFDDDDNDETELESASSASSPTSVLKNKDSGSNKSSDDCFCCSKLVTEEEEDIFDDAYDNWDDFTDALNSFGNEDKDVSPLHDEEDPTSRLQKQESDSSPQQAIDGKSSKKKKKKKKKKKSKTEKQQEEGGDEKSECPICSEEMDETDLSFSPCPCGYQLCLFCHKRIYEDDARCPSCRQKYVEKSNSGEVSFQQPGRGTLRLSPSFRGLDRA